MSEHMRARFESCAPERQDRFTRAGMEASCLRTALDEAAEKTRWYDGDGGKLVAWHNHCPLIVTVEPVGNPRLDQRGQPVLGYSHSVVVSGHLSSSSDTLAGAVQEAVMRSVECGREGSDSRWLNGKGGRKGFFASHGVVEGTTPSRTMQDFMVGEHMLAREAEPEESSPAPGPR